MTQTKPHHRPDQDPSDAAHDTPDRPGNDPQGASLEATDAVLEGQLGPDEISEPDEVVRNKEAKLHH